MGLPDWLDEGFDIGIFFLLSVRAISLSNSQRQLNPEPL